MLVRTIVVATLIVGARPAPTIITRDDVEDTEYVRRATQYEGLVHLNLPDGEGALVAPDWVLTAAHVGIEVEVGDALTVVGSGDYEVANVFIHPDWDDGPNDLALIRLRRPVEDIQPVVPYTGDAEVDMLVHVLGAGDLGTGLTGPVGNDGRIRAATNRVDSVSDYWLRWVFDDPSVPGSRATEFEGISGPGDSGGPALIEQDGIVYIVGVSSGQSTRATGGREGLYGVTEFYTRVSRYTGWIDATMQGLNAGNRTPA